jgi:hypothetical protein
MNKKGLIGMGSMNQLFPFRQDILLFMKISALTQLYATHTAKYYYGENQVF